MRENSRVNLSLDFLVCIVYFGRGSAERPKRSGLGAVFLYRAISLAGTAWTGSILYTPDSALHRAWEIVVRLSRPEGGSIIAVDTE